MITTFVISFREFLEAFLIISIFLGLSKKLKLKKEREIIIASILGVAASFVLPLLAFLFGDRARMVLNERNAELLEGYLMIFSGFFIAYVVFSLHKFFVRNRAKALISAHQKLEQNMFDISLFLTIVFFIVREGFEIALFTATTTLFSRFMENFVGLVAGFAGALVISTLAFLAYLKFSIAKVFKATEYMIILLGAAFVKNGINELLEVYYDIHIARILPIGLDFLPAKSTFAGHLLHSFAGVEQNFSLIKLAIMALYIFGVYMMFFRKNEPPLVQ